MHAKTKLLGSFALLLFGMILITIGVLEGVSEDADGSPVRLVYHTDHSAVLRACQQVVANPQAAGFPNLADGPASVQGWQNGSRPPAALDPVLRDLDFESMSVDANGATIFFGGGFGHWGYATAPRAHTYQLQVIPGLWFWSETGLPTDQSKFPYGPMSKRLLVGGLITLIAGVAFRVKSWQRVV
jgi:hypothetical protein